jgi:hypothetical protein
VVVVVALVICAPVAERPSPELAVVVVSVGGALVVCFSAIEMSPSRVLVVMMAVEVALGMRADALSSVGGGTNRRRIFKHGQNDCLV